MITPTLQAQDNTRGREFLSHIKRAKSKRLIPLIECLKELPTETQIQFAVCCVRLRDELEAKRGTTNGWGPTLVAELMWELVRGGHLSAKDE